MKKSQPNQNPQGNVLLFDNISKVYVSGSQHIVALDGVSFAIGGGEFVSIVGKSGSGKTTLIRLLIGEEKPTEGNVFFRDINVNKIRLGVLQKLRRKIGVIHQDYKLLPKKTVEENLVYVMRVIGAPKETIQRDVPQVLEIVGLEARANNFPHELSGGEKQRLAIARALIHRPELIVADEPTGNLDPYHTYEIVNLLQKINNMGTTVILATHNKEIIDSLKKRVITLDRGRLISDHIKGKFIL